MTPEQYQKIGELYHKALERAPDEREGYLREACAGDDDLRRKIEALLAAHYQAGEFLASPDPSLINVFQSNFNDEAPAGRQFGQYQAIDKIGEGGMGEVYLAVDLRLGRQVALKILRAKYTRDDDRVLRFKQEARAASATNHPNIITILDIGEVDGDHFIATEYVDGNTLRQRLLESPLSATETIEIAMQAAAALAAAHRAGVIHRDIKPENIMIRRDGYVKVLDFGLAKLTESVAADDSTEVMPRRQVKTNPGMIMGTFAYMSPEQALGQEVDHRSDIFSLGSVMYEMVTGKVPFDGPSPARVISAILNSVQRKPSLTLENLPQELERIITKALAKEPGRRYQNANELFTEFKSLRLELEIEARGGGVAGYINNDKSETKLSGADGIPDVINPALLLASPRSNSRALAELLEPVGGAVPLDSGFYILRRTDEKFSQAIARQDSIVLVKGARQVGKTSLLARGLQQAREAGANVVLTDFQSISGEYFETLGDLLFALAGAFADQLDLEIAPDEVWKSNRSPAVNFEQYLRREALLKLSSPIVWGLDEVDRLFTCNFGSEVFGLFRSWHNKRALDPQGPWQRLTLAIAYATEAHLFITDLNQSPFNVGTRLQLEDFTFEQVKELNERYGSPLKDNSEVARYFRLLSGHPYLVRRGLHELVTENLKLTDLEANAASDEGPFSDHLHRLLISLRKDMELCEVMRGVLKGKPCPTPESFYRLRSAGLAVGESTRGVRPRCRLYSTYLESHLL